MKLLEKLKNTFFEEEYIEVDEPEVKREEVAKKVEPKEVKKEIKKDEVKVTPVEEKTPEVVEEVKKIEVYSDGELSRKDSKLPYFEDDDFIDDNFNNEIKEEPKKIYGGSVDNLYNSINYSDTDSYKPYSAPVKEAFKPTPIISPIYGILDKNYRKEEVIDKKDRVTGVSSYVSRKNVDLDSVRKKAYGGLDPLEEINTTVVDDKVDEEPVEDNLLYDMTGDNSKPRVDKVTLADAEEYFEDLGLEYNIDYKDTRYEKATGRRTSQPKDESKEEVKVEEEKEVIQNEKVEEDVNLEDNLFDLIDTMYAEDEE